MDWGEHTDSDKESEGIRRWLVTDGNGLEDDVEEERLPMEMVVQRLGSAKQKNIMEYTVTASEIIRKLVEDWVRQDLVDNTWTKVMELEEIREIMRVAEIEEEEIEVPEEVVVEFVEERVVTAKVSKRMEKPKGKKNTKKTEVTFKESTEEESF